MPALHALLCMPALHDVHAALCMLCMPALRAVLCMSALHAYLCMPALHDVPLPCCLQTCCACHLHALLLTSPVLWMLAFNVCSGCLLHALLAVQACSACCQQGRASLQRDLTEIACTGQLVRCMALCMFALLTACCGFVSGKVPAGFFHLDACHDHSTYAAMSERQKPNRQQTTA